MSCCKLGPGYASPLDAFRNGPREGLLYVVCVQPDQSKQDYLATVDVDPNSPTYSQVIHRTYTGSVGDELHHSGWNVCSSCHDNPELKRNLLILPGLHSCNIFAIDVGTNPRKPELHKVIDGSEMRSFNCTFPHTAHCLASGEIMISTMGDENENGKGEFVLIDAKTLKVTGTWTKGKTAKFGYDFWYQPYHDVMLASEWGVPKYFKTGFHSDDIPNPERYGTLINVYKWSTHELEQVIDLGSEGCAPLEIRFLHDPKSAEGFVGCAVEANIYRFYKSDDGKWAADKVIDIPAKTVLKDGVENKLNGLMSDIILSLDDKYLYFSCWLHGDVRQYDISDSKNPKLTGKVQLGGQIANHGLKVIEDKEMEESPKPVFIKGKQLQGGPQMLQLSLDGKRLYVSSSLYSPWDKQFYPQMTRERTEMQLKKCWDNLKTRRKAMLALEKKERMRTGGGSFNPDIPSTSQSSQEILLDSALTEQTDVELMFAIDSDTPDMHTIEDKQTNLGTGAPQTTENFSIATESVNEPSTETERVDTPLRQSESRMSDFGISAPSQVSRNIRTKVIKEEFSIRRENYKMKQKRDEELHKLKIAEHTLLVKVAEEKYLKTKIEKEAAEELLLCNKMKKEEAEFKLFGLKK